VKFVAKKQPLGMLDGEYRQELLYRIRVRIARFKAGAPHLREDPYIMNSKGRKFGVNIRKSQLLIQEYMRQNFTMEYALSRVGALCVYPLESLIRFESIDDSIVEGLYDILRCWDLNPSLSDQFRHLSQLRPMQPPRNRSKSFWVYLPLDRRCYWTTIISEVIHPRSSSKLPFVRVNMQSTDNFFTTELDEEDIDMYIANGDSRDAAMLTAGCVICDVCLKTCGARIEASDLNGEKISDTLSLITDSDIQTLDEISPSLRCSGCGRVAHIACINTKSFFDRAILNQIKIENRDWFCVKCCSGTCESLLGAQFGYAATGSMTRREYERIALSDSGEIFENCKSIEDFEIRFWNILIAGNPPSETVPDMVLYASDLDSKNVAGGRFPTSYMPVNDPTLAWDLRHLALSPKSILRHLPDSADITGVSRPWMYLGSPASAFCWHTEDHFLCSISYMHEGAPKVWYSAPGKARERMNTAMKQIIPDLMGTPELPHNLVTMINPQTLVHKYAIPISRGTQNPGEFIITFPQAYHCGFNTGCNLAEAVNVGCPDWLPHGLKSAHHYMGMRKDSIICMDLLIWNVAEAIVRGEENDDGVIRTCVEYLTFILTSLLENDKKLNYVTLTEQTADCHKCHQFCFFGMTPTRSCLACASPGDEFRLTKSLKEIQRLIDKCEGTPMSVSDAPMRKSARIAKKISP
jgi:hypothetical protein